jgi:osomolarity two-component system, sensor histidine kinase SLN1
MQTIAKKLSFAQAHQLWTARKKGKAHVTTSRIRRKGSRIPQRVPEKHHLIHDELTDLTSTFNEMSDELSVQYSQLEERVKIRTAELEQSRNAAQDANESKTLFVTNISNELRTPLNGILGMCAVAIQEKDMSSVRQSLKIIYKSGSLLSHLLNDLLTFSRNSFG